MFSWSHCRRGREFANKSASNAASLDDMKLAAFVQLAWKAIFWPRLRLFAVFCILLPWYRTSKCEPWSSQPLAQPSWRQKKRGKIIGKSPLGALYIGIPIGYGSPEPSEACQHACARQKSAVPLIVQTCLHVMGTSNPSIKSKSVTYFASCFIFFQKNVGPREGCTSSRLDHCSKTRPALAADLITASSNARWHFEALNERPRKARN